MSGRTMRWLLGAGCTAAVALSAPGVASAAATGDCPKSNSNPWNLTATNTAADNKVDAKNAHYGKNDGFVCKRFVKTALKLAPNSIKPGRGSSSCNDNNLCGTDTDSDGLSDNYENSHTYANGQTSINNSDTDGDGLTDYQEVFPSGHKASDPTVADTDGDGRTDGQEVNTDTTDPTDTDTDNDTYNDGQEHTAGTNPNNACDPSTSVGACDQDSDGLTNAQEVDAGTDPTDADSDDDTYLDGDEVFSEEDPNDPCDPNPQAGPCDFDNDGLTSTQELANGTNYNDSDTDDDLISDGQEVNPPAGTPATDPTKADTDNDGRTDYAEINVSPTSNPNVADTDGDGRLDGAEVNNTDGGLSTSNPNDPDTDGDGRNDGHEVKNDEMGAKAASDPSKSDTDGDQLSDGLEVNTYHTNPAKTDTDGDGYGDGLEVQAGTDPNLASSHPKHNLMR